MRRQTLWTRVLTGALLLGWAAAAGAAPTAATMVNPPTNASASYPHYAFNGALTPAGLGNRCQLSDHRCAIH